MGKLANIWAFIGRHKYWVTIGAFLLIIGVLEDSKLLKEITSNKEALEKVAREKYLMKKENEDIFIFEEDK